VAVKIKLKRMGKIRAPYYRIIVADARTKRDGRAIEEIGKYHPKLEPSLIEVDSDRAQYWLSVGAQPTDPVRKLLEITGDWQRFKGLPGAEGTLRTAEAGPGKKEAFAAAVAETVKEAGKAAEGKADKGRSRRSSASSDKASASDKAPSADKAASTDKAASADKAAKAQKTDKADKTDKATAFAEGAKDAGAEQGKPAKAAKAEKTDKPEKAQDKPEKAEKSDKPAAKQSSGKPAKSAQAKADAGSEGEPAGAEAAASSEA
jgi:small subunit ribosomal protein S16